MNAQEGPEIRHIEIQQSPETKGNEDDRVALPDHAERLGGVFEEDVRPHVDMLVQVEEEAEVEDIDQHGRRGHEARHPYKELARRRPAVCRLRPGDGPFEAGPQQAEGQRQSHEHGYARVELEAYVQGLRDLALIGYLREQEVQKGQSSQKKQHSVRQKEHAYGREGLDIGEEGTAAAHAYSFLPAAGKGGWKTRLGRNRGVRGTLPSLRPSA